MLGNRSHSSKSKGDLSPRFKLLIAPTLELGEQAENFKLEQKACVWHLSVVIVEKLPQLQTLSPEEKLILVGELWDEIALTPDTLPRREDHIKIIQERLEQHRKNPSDVVAWEEVKARILGSS